jgi:vWA-MoxR associated protein C-terminal domain/Effector-associated domain 1
MTLNRYQRKQLKVAFLDAFPSQTKLRMFIDEELDKNLDELTSSGNLEEIIFELIKNAETYGWETELISAARNHNPGNLKLSAFAEELKLYTIVQVLESADKYKLQEWYIKSLSHIPGIDENYNNARLELQDVIKKIVDYPTSPNGNIPLLTFTEGLILKVPLNEDDTYKIREVVNDIVKTKYNVEKNEIEHLRKSFNVEFNSTQAKKKLAPSLMVLVCEVGGIPAEYDVSIYQWEAASVDGKSKWRQNLLENSVLSTIEEVKNFVSDKLSKIVQSFPDGTPQPIIEFLLPHTLFNLDVDQWSIRKSERLNLDLFIGSEYSVVIRFVGYAFENSFKDVVRKRWEIYHSLKPETLKEKIYWADEQTNDYALYYDISDEQACLAFPFTLGSTQQSLWDGALATGIPIALWFRKASLVSSCKRQYLEKILHCQSQQDISKLPSRIREKRRKAKAKMVQYEAKKLKINIDEVAEKEEFLGDCISLLWEDPNRFLVPDDYKSRPNTRALQT